MLTGSFRRRIHEAFDLSGVRGAVAVRQRVCANLADLYVW
jgi:hypothetical protein